MKRALHFVKRALYSMHKSWTFYQKSPAF